MKRILAPLLSLLVLTQVASAEVKIGVVDMVKAFNEFYKTKTASEVMQDNTAKVRQELQERTNSYKKLMEEADRIDKESRDPVLGQDARERKRAELQNKIQEIKAAEREITEFQQRRKGQLEQEALEKRRGLYEEISKAVQAKAKAANLDLVVDKAAMSVSGTPLFLYLKDGALPDITAEVIVELNKDAPAPGAAAPTAAAPTAPAAEPAPAPAPTKKKKGGN